MGSTPKQLYARAAGIVVTLTLHTLGQIMIYLSADHLGHLAPHLPLREVVQDLYSTDHLTQETRTRKYGIYGNVNHSRPYRAYPSERSTVDHQERTGDILWDIFNGGSRVTAKTNSPRFSCPLRILHRSGGGNGGLSSGVSAIWLCVISAGFNIDSFVVAEQGDLETPAPVARDVTPAPTAVGGGAYGGVPAVIPGVIEAEEFDAGGEGVGYSDFDPGNNGAVSCN